MKYKANIFFWQMKFKVQGSPGEWMLFFKGFWLNDNRSHRPPFCIYISGLGRCCICHITCKIHKVGGVFSLTHLLEVFEGCILVSYLYESGVCHPSSHSEQTMFVEMALRWHTECCVSACELCLRHSVSSIMPFFSDGFLLQGIWKLFYLFYLPLRFKTIKR